MPTKYTGRVLICLCVFLVAEYFILPPLNFFQLGKVPFVKLTNLKPGIDMVGGVSLVYKIKPPDTKGPISANASSLADQMMESLKRRIDPQGVRNLVWRPIGADELEIQMPASGDSSTATGIRDDYTKSLAALQATNIRQSDVLAAIELQGADRDKKLEDLSQGDPARLTLFKSLADMNDQLVKARAVGQMNPDAVQQANAVKTLDEVGQKFDEAKTHIEDDNFNPQDLAAIIDNAKKDPVKAADNISAIKARYANFPRRLAALNDFEKKYTAFAAVRSSLDDASALKAELKGSGVLEFHIVAFDREDPKFTMMFERMKPGGKGPTPQAGDDTYRWFEVDRPEEVGGGRPVAEWNGKTYLLCLVTPEASMTKADQWALERTFRSSDSLGAPAVGFDFDTNGGHLFGALTTRWQIKGGMQYAFAIILDGKVISAPNINQPITAGSGIIEGHFTDAELRYLIDTFNAGSAPAQLEDEPISEKRVGPALGLDNLKHGLMACGFGLIVVAIFLISYYYLAGVVAFMAVLLNVVIILGVMAGFSATFTLPSIAGVVLSVGTAVDANVLIFERLREEQHRGLGLRMALRNSYDSAFSAIVDSNMTSLITSLFLYWFGSEEVKGFGLTLIIGILASLFSALFFTKTVFGILIDKFGVKHLGSIPLTFPRWDKFLKPHIDWMGLAKYFYSFSIVAITAGLILFVYYTNKGEMMDIEFSAGTSVEFDLNEKMPIDEVRKLVATADPNVLPAPSVVTVGNELTAYEVVTPGSDAAAVRNAVVKAIGSHLKTNRPSRFVGVDDLQVTGAISNKVVFPIPADLRLWPGGDAPPQARDFPGGAAIQLTDINPPLKPSDIRQRINDARTQSPGADKISSLVVVAPVGDDVETSTATILVSNPAIVYSPEHEGEWRLNLATPAWDLVRGAINHEATFRNVSSFNASVAGDMRRDATIALTLSIIVIMAYIWIRFGNLKYGTATVVALLHDTVFTLAALGFAHLLADTWLAGPLELEKFRIGLTVVAGILTIMGYSMIDTIVVFDRIRENRGKYGHLSRMVVNDAINQTLSRTLLTCGTTTITVAFMYFVGGAGIHGFTFVLLTGILVGTYSSVAIAAPILLWTPEGDDKAPRQGPGSGQVRQPLPRPGTPPEPVAVARRVLD